MKIFQQRRLFFQAAKSGRTCLEISVEPRLRPCGWIAVTLAVLLLCSCSSLTPERVNTIAQIAGQAAAVGASEWLRKHPEHKGIFDAVIVALNALQRAGNTNEDAWVELLSSLPVDSLSGPDGGLYWSGVSTNAAINEASAPVRSYGGLIVRDAGLDKSTLVRGPARLPVMRATLSGLKRAMLPKPPVLVALNKPKAKGIEPETPQNPADIATSEGISLFTATPKAPLHVTSVVASATDVTTNGVSLRWLATPGSRYQIEHRNATNVGWAKIASPTNGPGAATWGTAWPTNRPVGQFRVVRVR